MTKGEKSNDIRPLYLTEIGFFIREGECISGVSHFRPSYSGVGSSVERSSVH